MSIKHILMRITVSLGLITTGLFITGLFSSCRLHDIDELQQDIFDTNCRHYFGKTVCEQIAVVLPSVLIAAGTVVLLFGINAFTKCVAVVGLITFAVFYANPLINTSFAELKYFLQVLICICAIMALEGKH